MIGYIGFDLLKIYSNNFFTCNIGLINHHLLSKCVVLCEVGDNVCFQSCAREYSENLKNCPCQENCPTGCPCPEYQCPTKTTGPSNTTTLATTTFTTTTSTVESTTTTTTTADFKTWILVLNTRYSSNVPLIIDSMGQSQEIGFTYGPETEVMAACSIIWRGQMYMFGGYTYKHQISVVDQCSLTKIGDLPIRMNYGACAQRNDEQIYICFEDLDDSSTGKNCHLANGPLENFSNLPSSTYNHANTRIAVTSGKQ